MNSAEFGKFMQSEETKAAIEEGYNIINIKGYTKGSGSEVCYCVSMKKPFFKFICDEINSTIRLWFMLDK